MEIKLINSIFNPFVRYFKNLALVYLIEPVVSDNFVKAPCKVRETGQLG
jgi:hypothetical protein